MVYGEELRRIVDYNEIKTLHVPPHTCYIEQQAKTVSGNRCLAWSGKAVIDGKKQITAVVWVGRDITSQKGVRRHHQHLSQRLMKSIEDERKKLALEIHDEVGQSVTIIHMELDSLNKNIPTSIRR